MINSYSNVFFDCDGVILDSNKLKSDAFYLSTLEYGEDKALLFKSYHQSHGGISRYVKFKYFIENILNVPFSSKLNEKLLNSYSEIVKTSLLECQLNDFMVTVAEASLLNGKNTCVITGGDQEEVTYVFKKRNILKYFSLGVFGSPKSKYQIFENLMSSHPGSTVYVGDSMYDYEVSKEFGADFLFYDKWTEIKDKDDWISKNNIKVFDEIDL